MSSYAINSQCLCRDCGTNTEVLDVTRKTKEGNILYVHKLYLCERCLEERIEAIIEEDTEVENA